jgi:methionyl-tRNA synthetase
MTRKVLITSALPYVNNVPHLGNLIGATLSADVYARFCRSRGYETLYVCGTDEHGTATETQALREGVTPKELCDKYAALHREIYAWFGIDFDVFGRTSDPGHVPVTQHLYTKLNENGFIFEQEIEQLYSEEDKMFLADRFVLGECPKCGFADARGDQCDNCGALLTPTELKNPRSAMSGATPVLKKTKHLYIDLPKLQPRLTEWLNERTFSDNTARETTAWLTRGLEPRAITRDLRWGVPVPREGYENKVFYVWFDAPIAYISMTSGARSGPDGMISGEQAIEYWWKDEKTELVQFMGKDNIPFHSVIFPCVLLGSGEAWVTVKHINTTEFLNFEGAKFSKSRGIGLFGDDAMNLEFPADAWRYYLLTNRPEQADTNFSWSDFQAKLNGELVANLGNLVNRTISFINQFYDGRIPANELRADETALWAEVNNSVERITHELDGVKIKDALHSAMRLCATGNAYFQKQEPWRTRKESPADAAAAIAALANLLVNVAIVIEPFLPRTARAICEQLNTPLPSWSALQKPSSHLGAEHAIKPNELLFNKVDDKRIAELRERFGGAQAARKQKTEIPTEPHPTDTRASDPFHATELVVGRIVSLAKHPKADKLYIIHVDLGSERGERTIVSGLVENYEISELEGKHIVVVANLAPAKLRGEVSQGMLLAAENGQGTVGVITTDAAPGTIVTAENEPHGSAIGAHEITYDVFSQLKLRAAEDGLYEGEKALHAGTHSLRADKNVQGPVH